MPPASEPRWRRRKEDRPAEIVAAAYSVFAEKGFAAARLDDIAARAGVSKGALYLYFETKQDIFEAVVRDAVAPNFDAMEQMAAAFPGKFSDLAPMMIARMAQLATTTPLGKVVKMVVGESGNFPDIARIWHDTLITRGLGLISGMIAKAQARGEIRLGDPRQYAVGLISPMLVGVIFRETFEPIGAEPFDIPALMQQHAATVLRGMAPDTADEVAS
jgi:AcrR family transcriptional regulator